MGSEWRVDRHDVRDATAAQPERSSTIVVGIGGLTAALALARAGRDVLVLEQAEHLGDVGAGIQLSPNATRVLYSLGLRERLESVAFLPHAIEARSSSGRLVMRQPLGDHAIARYGFPYLHLHRADLHAVLAEAAAADPHVEARLGARCAEVSADSSSARAVLAGSGGAWRPICSSAPTRSTRSCAKHCSGPPGRGSRGGELVNVVAVVEQDGLEVESWSERGDPAEPSRRRRPAAITRRTGFADELYAHDAL
jgi:salicylate hydroxylase